MRYLILIVMLAGCQRGLPHRTVDELTNWGQGHAPAQNHCPPGTLRVDTDEGLFLECFRGTD
jgi:hypothetical protein